MAKQQSDDEVPLVKSFHWIGSSKRDLGKFSENVRRVMGYGIYLAQNGERHESAKVLKGFGGAGVLEICEDDEAGTYRAVYTVKFAKAVYLLHAFQKKSTKGIATSKLDIELIRSRLKLAEQDYKDRYE